MTTFNDLRRSMPEFLDVPVPRLDVAFLLALQDICKETWAFQENLTIVTVADQEDYTLTPTVTGTAVCGVVSADYEDDASSLIDIDVINYEQAKRASSSWQTDTADGTYIQAVIYDGGTTVRLQQIPDDAGITFHVKVALYPTTEITVPTVIDRYLEAVKDFARWQIYITPKAMGPWSDPKMAELYYNMYQKKKNRLKREMFRGFGGSNTVKRRSWV